MHAHGSDARPDPIPNPDGFAVDVVVPTCGRPSALAVTLAGLVGQSFRAFDVLVSDQGEPPAADVPEVQAAARVLAHQGHGVTLVEHRPRRGLAEHRQFLLDRVRAPAVLFLDDDVLLEPHVLGRLVAALRRERCGFVGACVEAPSAVRSSEPVDDPPPELHIEAWDGPVAPEVVRPGSAAWERRWLHFAAHLRRVGERDGWDRASDVLYKVAWVGGCVLFDTAKLRAAGGFSFWPDLPPVHVGEDVAAQLAVMRRFGGAGLYPSGAWHQEVRTTLPDREHDAPHVLAR